MIKNILGIKTRYALKTEIVQLKSEIVQLKSGRDAAERKADDLQRELRLCRSDADKRCSLLRERYENLRVWYGTKCSRVSALENFITAKGFDLSEFVPTKKQKRAAKRAKREAAIKKQQQ